MPTGDFPADEQVTTEVAGLTNGTGLIPGFGPDGSSQLVPVDGSTLWVPHLLMDANTPMDGTGLLY